LEVDLLPRVLTHVPDVQVAGETVEAVAPRISKAKRPDLVVHEGIIHEWIVGRDEWRWKVDVEAQHLAEIRRAVLRTVVRILLIPPSPSPM
jgi:hypothetical protein